MAKLRVKELAEKKGLNISELHLLANRRTPGAKVGYTTIWMLWHNKTKRPDLETLEVVARALEVPPGGLIEGEDEDPEQPESTPEDIRKPSLVAAA